MDCVYPSPQENVRGRNEMARYLMKNLVFCRMHNTWWRHKPSVIYYPAHYTPHYTPHYTCLNWIAKFSYNFT